MRDRDEFARSALAGLLAAGESSPLMPRAAEPEGYAVTAYELADQMLLARQAKEPGPVRSLEDPEPGVFDITEAKRELERLREQLVHANASRAKRDELLAVLRNIEWGRDDICPACGRAALA